MNYFINYLENIFSYFKDDEYTYIPKLSINYQEPTKDEIDSFIKDVMNEIRNEKLDLEIKNLEKRF